MKHRKSYQYHPLQKRVGCGGFISPKCAADINPDVYTRGRDQDPRLLPLDRCSQPRSVWTRLEHFATSRMPRSAALIVTMAYTGVICICGFLSKDGSDCKELTTSDMTPFWAAWRQNRSAALVSCTSDVNTSDRTGKSQYLFSAVLNHLGYQSTCSKDCKEPTITSAIIDSCFQSLPSTVRLSKNWEPFLSPSQRFGNDTEEQGLQILTSSNIHGGIQHGVSIQTEEAEGRDEYKQGGHRFALPHLCSKYQDNLNGCQGSREVDRFTTAGPSIEHTTPLAIPQDTEVEEDVQAESYHPVTAYLSQGIHSTFTQPNTRPGSLIPQESVKKPLSSESYLDLKSSSENTSALHHVGHVTSRRVTSHKVVTFDDSSTSANHMSPVQLLSLLLLPEACV